MRGASEWHGADGPLWASDIGAPHALVEALIAGAIELGIPRNDDFNGAQQEGAGYYQLTTRRGLRCSTAVAYLRPARGRAQPLRRDRRARDARARSTAGARTGVIVSPRRPRARGDRRAAK